MTMTTAKLQCTWMPLSIVRLYVERSAYERAGRPAEVITHADIDAELADVARRIASSR
jgi:hypothetical protein